MGEPIDRTGDEDWSDWEGDDLPAYSLFETRVLPSAKDALAFDKEEHDFDLLGIKATLELDFYGCIKLVNYVRSETKSSPAAAIKEVLLSRGASVLEDERYLRPVLEDDALLLGLEELVGSGDWEDEDEDDNQDNASPEQDEGLEEGKRSADRDAGGPGAGDGSGGRVGQGRGGGESSGCRESPELLMEKENTNLKIKLKAAQERLALCSGIMEDLVGEQEDGTGGIGGGRERKQAAVKDNNTYYFRSYAHWGVHETMLTDKVRTGGYERAICGNPEFFKGKVVLDVGCGTGVLSCFAARAGASKVIGVDRSDIVVKAREVVKDNGFQDVVTLLQGMVEEIDIGVAEVDVIVSEWMGYCLFFETMLPSVLSARSRWLKKGGAVLPDRTPLFLQGWRDPDRRLEFWSNVHGLNYSSMAKLPLGEASVEVVSGGDIVTDRCLCKDFNIEEVEDKELDFIAPLEMKVTSVGRVSGFVVSFDVGFFAKVDPPPDPVPLGSALPSGSKNGGSHAGAQGAEPLATGPKQSWFSTGPLSTPTHWKQTLLWIRPEDQPDLEAGDAIIGQLSLCRNEINPREIDLKVTWAATQLRTGKTFGGMQEYSVC